MKDERLKYSDFTKKLKKYKKCLTFHLVEAVDLR